MTIVVMPNPARDPGVAVEVGQRLARARLALGLSQEELADAIGVGRTTLANWETGINVADVLAMARMAKRYGALLEWIYNGSLAGVPHDLADRIERAISPSDDRKLRRVRRAS